MGRVFKRKAAESEEQKSSTKRNREEREEEDEELNEVVDEEQESDESEDDSDEEDEESIEEDEEEGEENGDGDDEKFLDFDFEGFPMEENDRDGIVNMLTQTFLRTDIDLKGMADALIEQAPFGLVVGPADDEADEDDKNAVHAICTAIQICPKKAKSAKFEKDIEAFLTSRAKKSAPKEFLRKLDEFLQDDSTMIFVNERMLNFPTIIVPKNFASLRNDIVGLAEPPKNVIYIQKIRIGEAKEGDQQKEQKARRKMGKAEKKRLAASQLAQADIEFDNAEDKFLFELEDGDEMHFDYPVHMDVEPGSKFHVIEKKGRKWNPFRRLVLMDYKRFDAFLQRGMHL
ncbi:unnamed protein product [Caenorhabditis bovis]|uniref:Protein BCCIP homolog n=1 Tax=Caenorhabditis bovis TaxID=2654633 RepID=A0A8S1F3M8_9PELO|nr:unnamed protein product [Caenorhabditis bovis]